MAKILIINSSSAWFNCQDASTLNVPDVWSMYILIASIAFVCRQSENIVAQNRLEFFREREDIVIDEA